MTDQTTTSTPAPTIDDDVALNELIAQTEELIDVINQISRARQENFFRYLSKPTRNDLLARLLTTAGDVEDAAKAAHRALKKNKRQNLPETVADALLLGRRDLAYTPSVGGDAPAGE